MAGVCFVLRSGRSHKPQGLPEAPPSPCREACTSRLTGWSARWTPPGEAEWLHTGIPVQEVLPMKPETAAKIKYGVWGLICGAVIAMIIGFAWGGWTTSGTTQTMTREAGLARQAAICRAQILKQPNHEKKLKELEDGSR